MKPSNWKSWVGLPVFLVVVGLALGSVLILQGSTGATEKMESDGMLYVAHWTHTPENCPGRSKDGAQMLVDFWAKRDAAAKKGVKVLGGYVGVTEHTYFILVQAKDYQAMLEFFLPLVPTQTGTIHPVTTMDEWTKFIDPKKGG
jgi:hypothetical protein